MNNLYKTGANVNIFCQKSKFYPLKHVTQHIFVLFFCENLLTLKKYYTFAQYHSFVNPYTTKTIFIQ